MTEIKNVIIKDLFSKEEIEELEKSIDETQDGVKEGHQGRILRGLPDLSPVIVDKLTRIARQISLINDLELKDFGFCKYSKEYGDPYLSPHLDYNQPDFTIDYQYSSNIDWSLYVEGKKINLQNNDAVTFMGSDQVHWRSPRKFVDGEYTTQMFFHFKKMGSNSEVGYGAPMDNEAWYKRMQEIYREYEDRYMETAE